MVSILVSIGEKMKVITRHCKWMNESKKNLRSLDLISYEGPFHFINEILILVYYSKFICTNYCDYYSKILRGTWVSISPLHLIGLQK